MIHQKLPILFIKYHNKFFHRLSLFPNLYLQFALREQYIYNIIFKFKFILIYFNQFCYLTGKYQISENMNNFKISIVYHLFSLKTSKYSNSHSHWLYIGFPKKFELNFINSQKYQYYFYFSCFNPIATHHLQFFFFIKVFF